MRHDGIKKENRQSFLSERWPLRKRPCFKSQNLLSQRAVQIPHNRAWRGLISYLCSDTENLLITFQRTDSSDGCLRLKFPPVADAIGAYDRSDELGAMAACGTALPSLDAR